MATIKIKRTNGKRETRTTKGPMSREERATMRQQFDRDGTIELYEIIPTHAEERTKGAWGEWMSPEKMLKTWKEMAPPPKQGPKKRRAPTLQVTGTTPEQQERWQAAADRAGLPLAAWIRKACDGPGEEDLDRAASLLATFGVEQYRRGAEGKPTTADVRARSLAERIVKVLRS